MAENSKSPDAGKGKATPKAPQNRKQPKAFPTRVQGTLYGASTGVKEIEGQQTFSLVAQVPGGTVELLWPLDVTGGVIDAITETYEEAKKVLGIEDAQEGDYAKTPEGVVDLSDVKRKKRNG